MTYDRSGGIAGEITHVVVSGKGHVTVESTFSGDGAYDLSAQRLQRIKRVLREAGFDTLRSSYNPDVFVADGISEGVRYAGKSVSTSTGGDPPERFERVLAKLRRLA